MLAEKTMGWVVKFRDLSKPSMFMLCYVFWNMQRATCNSMVHVVPRIRPAQNGEALWVQRVLAVHRALSAWNQLPGKDSRVLDVFWTFGDVFGSNFGSVQFFRSVDIPYHIISCHVISYHIPILSHFVITIFPLYKLNHNFWWVEKTVGHWCSKFLTGPGVLRVSACLSETEFIAGSCGPGTCVLHEKSR
jgi:hypothetical protein